MKKTYPALRRTSPRQQRGIALLLVAVLMLALGMVGIVLSITSSTQFRLAANAQFENVAFNLAETGVAAAEQWLTTSDNHTATAFTTRSSATPHIYPIGFTAANGVDPMTMTWDDSNSIRRVAGDESSRYMIEKIGRNKQLLGTGAGGGGIAALRCPKADLFRVTALGLASKGTRKLVQTIYSVKLADDSCDSSTAI